jgi:hypothetical protein
VGVLADGVLDEAEPEVDEPALMSVGAALEPEAPIEVPPPVEPVAPVEPVVLPMLEPVPVVEPAVVSVLPVLGVVPIEPEPEALPVVLLGDVVVDGVVVLEVDELADSSFLPQALRDKAAIRARAAHCAIGDLIIRNSLRVSFRSGSELTAFSAACGSL